MNSEEIESQLKKLKNPEIRDFARNQTGVAGLIELARSYVLVLPRDWVELNCDLIEQEDGKPIPWVQYSEGDGDNIVITPLSSEALAKLLQSIEPRKNKKEVEIA